MRSVRVVSSQHCTFSNRLEKQEHCIFINSVNHTDGKLNCFLHQENAGRLITELGCPPTVPSADPSLLGADLKAQLEPLRRSVDAGPT